MNNGLALFFSLGIPSLPKKLICCATIFFQVNAGFEPSKETLKKVRRRCIREMDYESNDRVNALARKFEIRMGAETRRDMLFNLDYSTEYA